MLARIFAKQNKTFSAHIPETNITTTSLNNSRATEFKQSKPTVEPISCFVLGEYATNTLDFNPTKDDGGRYNFGGHFCR